LFEAFAQHHQGWNETLPVRWWPAFRFTSLTNPLLYSCFIREPLLGADSEHMQIFHTYDLWL